MLLCRVELNMMRMEQRCGPATGSHLCPTLVMGKRCLLDSESEDGTLNKKSVKFMHWTLNVWRQYTLWQVPVTILFRSVSAARRTIYSKMRRRMYILQKNSPQRRWVKETQLSQFWNLLLEWFCVCLCWSHFQHHTITQIILPATSRIQGHGSTKRKVRRGRGGDFEDDGPGPSQYSLPSPILYCIQQPFTFLLFKHSSLKQLALVFSGFRPSGFSIFWLPLPKALFGHFVIPLVRRPPHPTDFTQLFNWASKLLIRFELLSRKVILLMGLCWGLGIFDVVCSLPFVLYSFQVDVWPRRSAGQIEGQEISPWCVVHRRRLFRRSLAADFHSCASEEALSKLSLLFCAI